MESAVPTEKLEIRWPYGFDETEDTRDLFNDEATVQILEFGAKLLGQGKRAWFEVWYVGHPIAERNTTEFDFDAVEVLSDGTIKTLPPYRELVS